MESQASARLLLWKFYRLASGELLTKVDKATSVWGIEARVPFLDHRVVELALTLPATLTVVDGQGKWILRRVGERFFGHEAILGARPCSR